MSKHPDYCNCEHAQMLRKALELAQRSYEKLHLMPVVDSLREAEMAILRTLKTDRDMRKENEEDE